MKIFLEVYGCGDEEQARRDLGMKLKCFNVFLTNTDSEIGENPLRIVIAMFGLKSA